MKKIFFFIVFCECMCITISCTDKKQKNAEAESVVALSDYENQVTQKIILLEESNNGLLLKNQEVYFGNDSLNTMLFEDLAKEKKLYFYFSYNTCSPCIQECVDMLERYIPDYLESDKVIFLSPDYLPRFRNSCYGKRLLGLKNECLGISLEEENVPFFFVLDRNLKITSLHVVNKNDFERTGRYLKGILFND